MKLLVRPSLMTSVLLLVPLAGCLDAGGAPLDSDVAENSAKAQLLALLMTLEDPAFDAMKAVDWWEAFVKSNDMRQFPLPKNHLAAAQLENELRSAGFEARTWYHTPSPLSTSNSAAPLGFRMVQGIKQGEAAKDHRIVLVSHFDTVPTTAQGAYDDGSGVAAQLHICKLLAKVKMNKTLECVFFDNEENGLLASRAYTEWYNSTKPAWVWDQAFGYDMTGLNWPGYAKWKLYSMVGSDTARLRPTLQPNALFMETIAYSFLGPRLNVTTDGVEVLQVHDRNSDEQNFKRLGIPVIRFAGGRKAADYPQYHKADDTVEYVYRFACECADLAKGKETFARGFGMVVTMSYYTILAYDKYDPKSLPFQ